MGSILRGKPIIDGIVDGEAFVSQTRINLLHDLDMQTGKIIRGDHPDFGTSIAGKILEFLGGIVLNIIVVVGTIGLMNGVTSTDKMLTILFFVLLAESFMIIYFFRNRKYVAIGMLAFLLLPLLLFGLCVASFA